MPDALRPHQAPTCCGVTSPVSSKVVAVTARTLQPRAAARDGRVDRFGGGQQHAARGADEVGGRAGGDDPAGVDDVHEVGEALGLLEVVRAEHHRHAVGPQVGDEVPGGEPRLRVEPGRRLVEEHQLRPPTTASASASRRCWPPESLR
jgi:hypothetical protein